MDCLGEKLGPLLFQFGYFNKSAFPRVDQFLAVLVPFLRKLPKGYKFAVEIRNSNGSSQSSLTPCERAASPSP